MADEKTIQEQLFEAMYTIVQGAMAEQSYDITKECKIVEAYTDANGNGTDIYKVKSQDAVFDAYAKSGDTYKVGQYVYVQIPNGDYDKQKFIVGLKVDTEDEQDIYNLRMPFDDFQGFYNLSDNTPIINSSYWANDPNDGKETKLVAEEDDLTSNEDLVWHWENQGQSILATRLGLEVNIQTLLHSFNPISGKYGLRIVIAGKGVSEQTSDRTEPIVREYYFTSDNMYGNPYAYTMESTQQIVVDISDFTNAIDTIDVWFWQDHNFYDEFGEKIPCKTDVTNSYTNYIESMQKIAEDETLSAEEKEIKMNALILEYNIGINNSSAELPNIIFSDMHLLLGVALEDLQKESITLYTYDVTTYGQDTDNEEVNASTRTLRASWVHAVDNTIELINTYERLAELEANIYWYHYNPDWVTDDTNAAYDSEEPSHRFGGNFWEPMFAWNYKQTPPGKEDGKNTELNYVVTPDMNKAKERYKVVIHYNNTYVTSNAFIFTNWNPTVEEEYANAVKNNKIILRCGIVETDDDGNLTYEVNDTLGNFFVYNENNSVLKDDNDVSFAEKQYFLELWIKEDFVRDDIPEADKPISTGGYVRLKDYLQVEGLYNPDAEDKKFIDGTVVWDWPESYSMIRYGEGEDDFRRTFYISSTHNVRYSNNTVHATVSINGLGTCSVSKELLFGRAGGFGCEYTPVISIVEPTGNYVIAGSQFQMKCVVYNRLGQACSVDEATDVKFAWKFLGTTGKLPSVGEPALMSDCIGSTITGRQSQMVPFIVEVTVSNLAEYDITTRQGIMIGDNSDYMQTHEIICPNRVEFRADGQNPIYDYSAFDIIEYQTESENLYRFPTWEINNEKVLTLNESDLVENVELTRFTTPTGSWIGSSTKGGKSKYYVLKLSSTLLGEQETSAPQWSNDLLSEDYFTYIYFTDKDAKDNVLGTVAQAIAFSRNEYSSSLVNEWNGQSLTLDEENSAVIAKMIAAGTKNSQNRFTGVMMGNWSEKGDESLDTPGLFGLQNGAQTFALYTDGSGFIGPSGQGRIQFDGKNALISNSTKTCYINLNPINTASYLTYNKTTGNYNFNTEAWAAINNQGYSENFLYAAIAKNGNIADPTGDFWDTVDTTIWCDRYLWKSVYDEASKKYVKVLKDEQLFVVNPNYGIFTSGGIFASYGRIGLETPWYICDYGLTQKNIYGRIFLGNPEKNLSTGPFVNKTNPIIPTFTTTTGDEKELDDKNFFSASFSNINNVIQTGIRADGYLYTQYATIADWCINDGEIYCPLKGGFRKTYEDDGYTKDALNLNSKEQFLSFNEGRMVINGKYGWMGFYSLKNEEDNTYNVIELTEVPNAYNMLIDFKGGTVNFGKIATDPVPYTQINGINGNAYFSQGRIVLDGDNATIYCGVTEKLFDNVDGGIGSAAVSEGYLYLADIQFYSKTVGVSSYSNLAKTSIVRGAENNVSFEEGTNIKDMSEIWGGTEDAGYYETADSTYVPGTQYYTDINGTKFVPTFVVNDITVTPISAVNVSSNLMLLSALGYEPVQSNDTIILQSSSITSDGLYVHQFILKESSTGEMVWTLNDDSSINLSDYGLSITQIQDTEIQEQEDGSFIEVSVENADPSVTSIMVTITVTVGNWILPIYEYSDGNSKLTPLQTLNRKELNVIDSSDTVTISGTGSLKILQDGIGIEGLFSKGDSILSSSVVLSPCGVSSGYLYNWEIDAKNIYIQDSLVAMGIIKAPAILMYDSSYIPPGETNAGGYALIATQCWVENYAVQTIWPKIKMVNNAAYDAMVQAKKAYNKALTGINLANEALAKTIVAIQLTERRVGPLTGLNVTYTTNDGTTYQTESLNAVLTNEKHAHGVELEAKYGSLRIKSKTFTSESYGDSGYISIFQQYGGLSISESNGSIKIDVTVAGTTSSQTFNMASTQFYLDAIEAAREEGYAAAVARCGINTSTNKVSYASGTYANQSTVTKTATASGKTVSSSGTSYTPYRIYGGTNVPATGVYTNTSGQSTGSFSYTGNHYKAQSLSISTSISWS